ARAPTLPGWREWKAKPRSYPLIGRYEKPGLARSSDRDRSYFSLASSIAFYFRAACATIIEPHWLSISLANQSGVAFSKVSLKRVRGMGKSSALSPTMSNLILEK